MSTNDTKDLGANGETLSRDSLQRLAKLRVDVALMARLVRTRQADALSEGTTESRLGEMANHLTWLETQIGQVLADHDAPDISDEPEAWDDDTDAETAGADPGRAKAEDNPYVAGITLDQIDEINLLLESILAHGDVVTAADHAEFAVSTLPVIGHAIYRETGTIRDLISDILDDQPLEPPHGTGPGVREEQGSYLALPAGLPGGGMSSSVREHLMYQ